MADQRGETFRPTSGRFVGVLGLGAVVPILLLGVIEGFPLWGLGLLAMAGVLVWTAMLRPGVRITDDELVLRNMFVTHVIPLAAVEEVAVGRVLAVRAADRRFVSAAIGRTLRQSMRPGPPVGAGGSGSAPDLVSLAESSYPDYVVERIRLAASGHRERLGVGRFSDEHQALGAGVRNEPAWVELGVLGVAFVVLVVGIVLVV